MVTGVALASSREVQDCARVGLAAIGNVLLRLMNMLVDEMWKLFPASVESCQLAALHSVVALPSLFAGLVTPISMLVHSTT
jgi:hypothetical protein